MQQLCSGYDGSEGVYFSSRELEAAYETEGLALDHWTGCLPEIFVGVRGVTAVLLLNRGFRKYFDNPAAVNKSEMKPCSETNFANDNMMSTYLQFTGDTAGVQILPDGKKVAVCPDGYFFIMPACRSDSSKCIIYMTAGLGYGTTTMSQKAVKWNMPLALGVAKDWGTTAAEYKSVFYWLQPERMDVDGIFLSNQHRVDVAFALNMMWIALNMVKTCLPSIRLGAYMRTLSTFARMWVPDPTFLALSPVTTAFPAHDKLAWAIGDVSTAGAGTPITKIVSGDLKVLSARLEKFVENLKVDIETVNKIMLEQLNTGEEWEPLVCRWLQNNEEIWGEHQDETGQQFCKRCEVGFFQDEEGGALCKQCPANSRTLQKGSLSFSDCGCESDYIDVATASGHLGRASGDAPDGHQAILWNSRLLWPS
eukprot:Skav217588  [mRNA]  locus=scaffold3512:58692:63474:- [translate_table: standard]